MTRTTDGNAGITNTMLKEAPLFSPPKEKFFSVRGSVSGRQGFVLGLLGLIKDFWAI
jgi:hypothetical protein